MTLPRETQDFSCILNVLGGNRGHIKALAEIGYGGIRSRPDENEIDFVRG
jgi:hypothetical protein